MDETPSWVLDTTVVVSGLLSATGPPGRLIDMVLARKLMLTLDDRIEAEYREVLSRPKFRIDPSRREAFLAILAFQDLVTAGPWPPPSPPDEDDVVFLEVASCAVSVRPNAGCSRSRRPTVVAGRCRAAGEHGGLWFSRE